ncbi:LysE family transporter [Yersinia enterocolitica]|nr:LysE family transporter [Yersinia enterocolitica]
MISKNNLYPSYFKLHVRWLPSFTRIIDWRQLIGTLSFAAFLQLELFRVYFVYQ